MSHRFSKRELVVYANPWGSLDHKGRPCHACACDPVAHTPDRRFVGAELDMKRTTLMRQPVPGERGSVPQDTVWTFSKEPVRLPVTDYYKDKIRKGDVFAADRETAALAGISEKDYVEPLKMLADAEKAAIARFDSMYGEGAYAFLKAERDAAEKARADAEAQAAEPETKPVAKAGKAER